MLENKIVIFCCDRVSQYIYTYILIHIPESEKMFSKSGSLISDRRTALKAKNVSELIFLNKNKWIIE